MLLPYLMINEIRYLIKRSGAIKTTPEAAESIKKMMNECKNQVKINSLGEWEIYNPGEGMVIISSCADNDYHRENVINSVIGDMLKDCPNRIKWNELDEKQNSFFSKFSNMANNVVNFIKSIFEKIREKIKGIRKPRVVMTSIQNMMKHCNNHVQLEELESISIYATHIMAEVDEYGQIENIERRQITGEYREAIQNLLGKEEMVIVSQ